MRQQYRSCTKAEKYPALQEELQEKRRMKWTLLVVASLVLVAVVVAIIGVGSRNASTAVRLASPGPQTKEKIAVEADCAGLSDSCNKDLNPCCAGGVCFHVNIIGSNNCKLTSLYFGSDRVKRYKILIRGANDQMAMATAGPAVKGSAITQWGIPPGQTPSNYRFIFYPYKEPVVNYFIYTWNCGSGEHSIDDRSCWWDIKGDSKENGGQLINWSLNYGHNQRFILEPLVNGYHRIKVSHSGLYLTKYHSLENNGGIVQYQWLSPDTYQQTFKLVPF